METVCSVYSSSSRHLYSQDPPLTQKDIFFFLGIEKQTTAAFFVLKYCLEKQK